jgi:hypothetical protein
MRDDVSLRLALLAPLHDAVGRPFDHVPCQDAPELWDEDSSEGDKRAAANICKRVCPALEACSSRRHELGARASGVWAGQILRRRNWEKARVIEDPELASWAAAAGVTIPSPDLHRKAAAQ